MIEKVKKLEYMAIHISGPWYRDQKQLWLENRKGESDSLAVRLLPYMWLTPVWSPYGLLSNVKSNPWATIQGKVLSITKCSSMPPHLNNDSNYFLNASAFLLLPPSSRRPGICNHIHKSNYHIHTRKAL